MSKEAMLGLFVMVVLAVFLFFTVNMGTFLFSRGNRHFNLYFNNIGTLEVGAPVKQAGFDIGEVNNIALETIAEPTPTTYIVVGIRVSDDALISVDSVGSIQTLGMMGEKYIEVSFGRERPATSDDRLDGQGPYEIDRVIQNAVALTNEVMETVKPINRLVGDPKVLENARKTVENIGSFSESLNAMVGGGTSSVTETFQNLLVASAELRNLIATAETFIANANGLVVDNRRNINTTLENTAVISQDIRESLMSDVKEVARNLRDFSTQLEETMNRANTMIAKMETLVDENRGGIQQTITNFKDVSDNARNATKRMDDIFYHIQNKDGFVHDVIYDKEFSSTAKGTVEQASGVLTAFNSLPDRLSFEAELLYFTESPRFDPDNNSFRGDLGIRYDIDDNWYVYAGGNDLGASNKIETQLGYRYGQFGLHGGIIESELGVGIDWYPIDRLTVTVEGVGLTDRHEERLDAYTQFRVWNDIYLIGGVQDITDELYPNAGVKVRF